MEVRRVRVLSGGVVGSGCLVLVRSVRVLIGSEVEHGVLSGSEVAQGPKCECGGSGCVRK